MRFLFSLLFISIFYNVPAQINLKEFNDISFSHFNDLIIVEERINEDGIKLDTIYSCNYDTLNRIIAERNSSVNSMMGITFYFYDPDRSKLLRKVYLEEVKLDKQLHGLTRAKITEYNYTEFDSISKEIYRDCQRVLTKEAAERLKNYYKNLESYEDLWRGYPETMSDYTQGWECSETYYKINNYERKNIVSSILITNFDTTTWKYSYNNNGRLKFLEFSGFQYSRIWYQINDSNIVEIDTSYFADNYMFHVKKTVLNEFNLPTREIIEVSNLDLTTNLSKIFPNSEIIYLYDKNNKLIEKQFYWDNKNTRNYKYYYRN